MKLTSNCPNCGRVKTIHCEYKRTELNYRNGHEILIHYKTYKCGHTEILETDLTVEEKFFASLNGKKSAYQYQRDGLGFTVQSDYNCLIADAMGLGKTIQAELAIRTLNKFPVLIVVKSATTMQWIRETHEWAFNDPLAIFPIIGTKSFIPPGFKCYLISMDTLGRNGTWKKLVKMGFKCVVVDECHSFKDEGSSRTAALIQLIREGKIAHKIFLSGTPIKNRAGEYFTVLNLLAPDYFPSQHSFKTRWLEPEGNPVQYKRLNPYRVDQFKELISKWVIRREKHEVLKDLPSFTRNFQYITIEDQDLKNSYNKQLDLMQNLMNSGQLTDTFSILGQLQKLRRLTGLAKISTCHEYVTEFLENTDDKIAIGIQHESVRDALYVMLQKYNCLKLSGEDSTWRKDDIVQRFKEDKHRVLVINELAGGVGLNLQMCANCLVLERQWNAADEEQFESRFHRNGQTKPVIADYMIASGTIDEWFHNMNEEKRQICGETLSGYEFTSDRDGIKALFDKTVHSRL